MSKAPGPLSGGAQLPAKGMKNTNTRGGQYAGGKSTTVQFQASEHSGEAEHDIGRGGHGQAISGGAQLLSSGMKNYQTRNSSGVVKQ
jgi:hypothetical protein